MHVCTGALFVFIGFFNVFFCGCAERLFIWLRKSIWKLAIRLCNYSFQRSGKGVDGTMLERIENIMVRRCSGSGKDYELKGDIEAYRYWQRSDPPFWSVLFRQGKLVGPPTFVIEPYQPPRILFSGSGGPCWGVFEQTHSRFRPTSKKRWGFFLFSGPSRSMGPIYGGASQLG